MICKWCGEKLDPSTTHCKRCGRETPAMSDCGGYYKLGSAEPVQRPASRDNSKLQRENDAIKRALAKLQKRQRADRKVLYFGLSAALVLIVVLFVLVVLLNAKVNRLASELEQLAQPVLQHTQDAQPADADQLPGQVGVNLTIIRSEGAVSVMGDVQIGETGGSEALLCDSVSDAGVDTYKANVFLPGQEDAAEILLIKSTHGDELISVEFRHQFDRFYGADAQCYPVWKYRTGADQEWQNLPEAGFAMKRSESGYVLEASSQEYRKLSEAGYVELCLLAEITFAGGQTVTVSVEGLPVQMD